MSSLLQFNRRVGPIGVDMGASGVRAVQLLRQGKTWVMRHEAQVEHRLPGEGSADEACESSEILTRCLCRSSFSSRSVAFALDSPDIEYLPLDLPAVVLKSTAEELQGAARFEVERLSSAAAGGMAIETGFWILPSTSATAPNALGVATPSERVAQRITLAETAGVECVGMDGAALAHARFALNMHKSPENRVWGLLDLGYRQTRLVLMIADIPVLARSVGVGGKALTAKIASVLHVSEKAAEVIKREHGVDDGRLGSMLNGVLRSELTELATEVKRSYEYVLSCYPNRQAGLLLLVGGGAGLPNLSEFFSELLGIQVLKAGALAKQSDCLIRGPAAADTAPPSWETLALAIGLALDDTP